MILRGGTAELAQKRSRPLLAIAALSLQIGSADRACAVSLPPEFQGIAMCDPLDGPVGMAFASDGRIFVCEQRGVVRVIENGQALPNFFIDLRDEVNFAGDRGMLGIALDPDFDANHFVYLLYTVDPILGQPDEPPDAPTFARLTRYTGTQESNGAVADLNSRHVIIGLNPSEGLPACWTTHTIGAVRFGLDGSLLVSNGDAAKFQGIDAGGVTPGCFQPPLFGPEEDIGAFRSQWLGSTCGKILRIDPATGQGLPSNPFWTGDPDSIQSKVWVSGLRNPFRFSIRPGSADKGEPGTIYVSDVGWNTYEEVSVARMGDNLGWPCYEGLLPAPTYPSLNPPAGGCDEIETPLNPGALTFGIVTFHHNNWQLSSPQGPTGQAAISGIFHTGDNYPAPYRGGYFYSDFIQGWIKVLKVDENDGLVALHNFGNNGAGPVDYAIDPLTNEVCYLSLLENRIYRIHSLVPAGDSNHDGDVDVSNLLLVING